jgi:hypothetical protein
VAHGSTDPLSSRIFVATNAESVDQTRLRRHEAAGKLRPLFDEMLKGIGGWLCAACCDDAIVDDSVDVFLPAPVPRTDCCRYVTAGQRRAGDDPAIALLAAESLDDVARELSASLDIDRLHAPFTRCLATTRASRRRVTQMSQALLTARRGASPIMRCPRCGRIF